MADAEKIEKIPMQAMPEQYFKERAHNFNEVPYGFTRELAIIRVKINEKLILLSELEQESVL